MRIIDADALCEDLKKCRYFGDVELLPSEINAITDYINDNAPTIATKQIKYFDEDEKVWKTGEVIVDE